MQFVEVSFLRDREKGKEGWINDVRDVRHKQNKQYSYYLT